MSTETEQQSIQSRQLRDFRYDQVRGKYWDTTTGELRSARSVDAAIPRKNWPAVEEDRNGNMIPVRPSVALRSFEFGLQVEESVDLPGKPMFIRGILPYRQWNGREGIRPQAGVVVFNRGYFKREGGDRANRH